MSWPDEGLTDFERRVVAEASSRLPENVAAACLDSLVRKGYVKERSGRYRTTGKFTDLIADAADDIDKHVTPIKKLKDPRPILAWHMARILLGYGVDTPHDRMNPEEMGRFMNVIHSLLQRESLTMLRFALSF